MKITKKHIQKLTEQYLSLNEEEYPDWMQTDYKPGTFWNKGSKDMFLKQHPNWSPDYKNKINFSKGDFEDPTFGGEGTTTYNNQKLTLPYRDVAKYQWDARTDDDIADEKTWGKPDPEYGGANIIQVDRPEGKRFYGGVDKSWANQPDSWLTKDAQYKAEYSPADSLTTKQVYNYNTKKDLGMDDDWFKHRPDLFKK